MDCPNDNAYMICDDSNMLLINDTIRISIALTLPWWSVGVSLGVVLGFLLVWVELELQILIAIIINNAYDT